MLTLIAKDNSMLCPTHQIPKVPVTRKTSVCPKCWKEHKAAVAALRAQLIP